MIGLGVHWTDGIKVGQTGNVKMKNMLQRIGDGAVSGIGLLIVASLGGFLWTAYQDALGRVGSATDVLREQLDVNKGLKAQVDVLTARVESLWELVEANQNAMEIVATQLDSPNPDFNLDSWRSELPPATMDEARLLGNLTADPYETLDVLLETQASLLQQR